MSDEGDVSTGGEKKHKKRKSSDLGGEDGSVQLADESRPNKKMKMQVLGDTPRGVPDVDFRADTYRSSRKEKRKKVSGVDVDTLGDDYKSKGKMKKGKSGDRGEASKVSEASVETVNEEYSDREVSKLGRSRKEENRVKKNEIDTMDRKEDSVLQSSTGVANDIEMLKGGEVPSREEGHVKMKKKTKSEGTNKSNENVGDASFVDKQIDHKVTENKKQKHVKDSRRWIFE